MCAMLMCEICVVQVHLRCPYVIKHISGLDQMGT